MRKMDKWFVGAPRYWFLVGALWCAAAVASLWEGRAGSRCAAVRRGSH